MFSQGQKQRRDIPRKLLFNTALKVPAKVISQEKANKRYID